MPGRTRSPGIAARPSRHVTVSRASVARYLAAQGLVTPQPSKRPRSSYILFQAEQPNECWQADFTHYRLTRAGRRPRGRRRGPVLDRRPFPLRPVGHGARAGYRPGRRGSVPPHRCQASPAPVIASPDPDCVMAYGRSHAVMKWRPLKRRSTQLYSPPPRVDHPQPRPSDVPPPTP